MLRIAIVSFTDRGDALYREVVHYFTETQRDVQGFCFGQRSVEKKEFFGLKAVTERLGIWAGKAFECCEALIFVGAAGIAVRSIAPYVKDKFKDPAVLVIDEGGEYVIPILSGHVGGANELARELAERLSAQAIITTATDGRGAFAVDVFAKKNGLILTDKTKAKKISADILAHQPIGIWFGNGIREKNTEHIGNLAQEQKAGKERTNGLFLSKTINESRIVIDCQRHREIEDAKNVKYTKNTDAPLVLIPEKILWVGVGCRRGVSCEDLENAWQTLMCTYPIYPQSVAGVASVDRKADEAGLLAWCKKHQWDFRTFSVADLQAQKGNFSTSEFVRETIGVDNVCERASLCAAGEEGEIWIEKQKFQGITMAVVRVKKQLVF